MILILLKKKSLQKIEDDYIKNGYRGSQLKLILGKDKQWQRLLRERKAKIHSNIVLTPGERKKYVMSTEEDYKILSVIKELEKSGLNKQDYIIIKLIRTQLEHDWRKPIFKRLTQLKKKYST